MKFIKRIIVALVVMLAFTSASFVKANSVDNSSKNAIKMSIQSGKIILLAPEKAKVSEGENLDVAPPSNSSTETDEEDEELDVIIPDPVDSDGEEDDEDLDVIIPDPVDDEGKDEEDTDEKRVFENDFSTNCADFSPAVRIAGIILLVAKVAIPLIIIVMATVNMFNTITNAGPDELKKVARSTALSVLSAVLILLAPTIVDVIFKTTLNIANQETENSDIDACRVCLFHPTSTDCSELVELAKKNSYGTKN